MGEPLEYIIIRDFSPGIYGDRVGGAGATLYPTAQQGNQTFSSMDLGQNEQRNYARTQNGQIDFPNGAATIKDTFGCTADDAGVLVPFPVGQGRFSGVAADTFGAVSDTAPTFYPTDRVGQYLLDARVQGYVDSGFETVNGCDVVYMAWAAYYDPSHTSTYRQLVWITVNRQGIGISVGGSRWLTIYWNKYSDTNPLLHKLPAINLAFLRNVGGQLDTDNYPIYLPNYVLNVLGFVVMGADSQVVTNQIAAGWRQGATAIPADEVALTNYTTVTTSVNYPVSLGTESALIGIYPHPVLFDPLGYNPLGLSEGKPRIVGDLNTRPASIAISHQGRFVMAGVEPTFAFATDTDPGMKMVLGDHLWYSPLYNAGLNTNDTAAHRNTIYNPAGYDSSVVGDENPSPIGCLGSITADELLVVKHRGGGVLVRGDMDNFTATSLPFIEPTSGVVCHGVGTPLGFVYGSRNGIFVWNGGQTTEKLSRQIDGFFWNHATFTNAGGALDEIIYAGNRGRMAYWHPFICVPNNYIYNTQVKAWWRLEPDTSVKFNIYDISSKDGCLFGFHYKNDPGAHYTFYRYDSELLRDRYSWRSHALTEDRERMYSVQTVDIEITRAEVTGGAGAGVFTLTCELDGLDADGLPTTRTMQLPVNAGTRQEISFQVTNFANQNQQGAFNAAAISVRVAFTTANPAIYQGPAPKIHRIKIGVSETRGRQPFNTVTG